MWSPAGLATFVERNAQRNVLNRRTKFFEKSFTSCVRVATKVLARMMLALRAAHKSPRRSKDCSGHGSSDRGSVISLRDVTYVTLRANSDRNAHCVNSDCTMNEPFERPSQGFLHVGS